MEANNDDTKTYVMQRDCNQNRKVIAYPVDDSGVNAYISVFVLYHDKNRKYVDSMQEHLSKKKIRLVKGFAETNIGYEERVDIVNNFDYLAILISKSFLEDLELLYVLLQNYEFEKANKKIIPIIMWNDLYKPEGRLGVIKRLSERIEKFKNEHFDDDFNENVADELKRMCQVLKLLRDFLPFAKDRDKKTTLHGYEKLLNYICYDRGIEVDEKEEREKGNEIVMNQTINVEKGAQLNLACDSSNINASLGK